MRGWEGVSIAKGVGEHRNSLNYKYHLRLAWSRVATCNQTHGENVLLKKEPQHVHSETQENSTPIFKRLFVSQFPAACFTVAASRVESLGQCAL